MMKFHREVIQLIRTMGGEDVFLDTGKKHCKVYWTNNGERKMAIVASSPSGTRPLKNAERDIRKLFAATKAPNGRLQFGNQACAR